MKQTYLFTLLLVLLQVGGFAQEPLFAEQPLGKLYRQVKPQVMLEDQEGFIWVGTDRGLFRYDGRQYELFAMPDSLCNNEVTALYENTTGQLWAGYSDGRVFHEQQAGQFVMWTLEEGLPVVPITGLGEGVNGQIWMATYGEGLYVHNGRHLYNLNTDDGLPGNDLYTLHVDEAGQAWVGTDGGISICSMQGQAKNIENITTADGLPDEIVRVIQPDGKGQYWIGTYGQGVVRYDPQSASFHVLAEDSPESPVNTILEVSHQEVWVGTDGDGLFRYRFAEERLQPIQHAALGNGKIQDLHFDAEGNLWVLHRSEGIYKANRRFELVAETLPHMQAVLQQRDGSLWVGTQEGLFRYDDIRRSFTLVKAENVISLHEGRDGHLYVGTFGNGLYCMDLKRGREKHLTAADGLVNGSVLDISEQGDTIWLATLGGVYSLRCGLERSGSISAVLQHFDQKSAVGTNFIYTVFPDSKGRVWFGTDGEGLSVLEDGKLRNYVQADSVPIQSVYSITEDQRGHIWFSTARQGVFVFDGEHFTQLSVKEGLRDQVVTSLITDTNGNVLIAHASGLDVLDPVSRHIIYFDEEAGLQGLDPNLNAVAKGQNRQLWLGWEDRLMRYTALDAPLAIHPRVVIKEVSVFLESVQQTSPATFGASDNNLVFEYVGLWYTSPEKVRYRYKLEGFDLDWIHSGDERAIYSNLPPGEYTFKVSATENSTFGNEPVARYSFTISLPVWQQWWFVTLFVLLVSGLAYFWLRQRDQQKEREALLLREKVESQYEALKSQINPHFLFNSFNTLITIIEENPKLGVVYVEKLSDFYRSILQYREQQLIALEEELRLVHDYTFLLQQRFGENLQLKVAIDKPNHYYVAPLALQMLVENAVKHNVISRSKPLHISLRLEGDVILVRNNRQAKRTKAPSTGFGLQNIITRYRLLSEREVQVAQTEHTFEVALPALQNGRAS